MEHNFFHEQTDRGLFHWPSHSGETQLSNQEEEEQGGGGGGVVYGINKINPQLFFISFKPPNRYLVGRPVILYSGCEGDSLSQGSPTKREGSV